MAYGQGNSAPTGTWSRAELSDMRRAYLLTAQWENRYGEFKSYVDCEDVVSDLLMDTMADDAHEGDIFWEMAQFTATAYYAGEKV